MGSWRKVCGREENGVVQEGESVIAPSLWKLERAKRSFVTLDTLAWQGCVAELNSSHVTR